MKFVIAGESHGKAIVAIIYEFPAGIKINPKIIGDDLKKRRITIGRGVRIRKEDDEFEIISGINKNKITTGGPITIIIKNKLRNYGKIVVPRPGHADLVGLLKYDLKELSEVSEKASARETVARVAVGSFARQFLNNFNIKFISHIVQLGGISISAYNLKYENIAKLIKTSKINCIDKNKETEMINKITETQKRGDTLGGVIEIRAKGVPVGLGGHEWYRKLDRKIAGAMMSIPSVKGVEIGLGFHSADFYGSELHDEIFYSKNKGYFRMSNRAGGIEGGMSNGEEIVVRIGIKPISTLRTPLKSVDITTKKKSYASYTRTDTCIVPSCCVIAEAMLAVVIANEFSDKFGKDSINEIKSSYSFYKNSVKK